MDQAHLCLRPVVLDLPPIPHLDLSYHHPNLNKVDMVDTQAISNKVTDFTAAKLVVNMVVLEVSEVTKLLDKDTRLADMEATKVMEVTRVSVTANNVVDGAATMDINLLGQE